MWLIDPASTGSGTQQYGTITDEYFASLFDPDDPDAPEPLKSRDGDGGFFYWLPIERNAVFGLVSVRADISKAAHPVLDTSGIKARAACSTCSWLAEQPT